MGRLEDARMITGQGRYVADWNLPGQAHAHFVRSDHAHAKIVSIDASAALTHPGVLAVLTGKDVAAAGFASLPTLMPVKGRGGSAMCTPPRPVLAGERVRFVGEPIAIVVAESAAIAQDAAELVAIDYEALPAVVSAEEALRAGAPALHEEAPGNLVFDFETGDEAKTAAAFATAPRQVSLTVAIPRVVGNPMELRGCLAVSDSESGLCTLHACTQGAFHMRQQLAKVTGKPLERIRIVAQDVGGSFGVRSNIYPEDCAVMLASMTLGRPVKWVASRAEVFLADEQGRDVLIHGELALAPDGRMLAMRFGFTANLGAYLTLIGPIANTLGATTCLSGIYDIQAVYARSKLALTNTAPAASYRGAGRPIMSYALERLVDHAAVELGIDPAQMRRRNLIPKTAFPYRLANGVEYDCGDFAAALDQAVRTAKWDDFPARRAQSARAGKLRGRGLAGYVEATSAGFTPSDQVQIRFGSDGDVTLHTTSHSQGQGHETTFAQIVCGVLGLPIERIRLVTAGASSPLLEGNLTSGSRSIAGIGSVLQSAAKKVIDNGRRLAAAALQVRENDVEFSAGMYRAKGKTLGLEALARLHANDVPHPLSVALDAKFGATFPNGCHIAEVEIDPDTGCIEVLAYIACDDMGNVINRQIVEGQIHGGLAQGAGEVLGEQAVYDRDNGQLVTGSFLDYPMPRADTICIPQIVDCGVPTKVNPLGAKGAGEAGVTGSLPALMNAIVDALRPAGVAHFDMPASPHRLWQAIERAKR